MSLRIAHRPHYVFIHLDWRTFSHIGRDKGCPSARLFARSVDASDKLDQFFQIFARRFLAGEGAEEDGQLGHQLFVFQDVIGDAPGIHGGVIEDSDLRLISIPGKVAL